MKLSLCIFACLLCEIFSSDGADGEADLQDVLKRVEQNVTELRDSLEDFRQSVSLHLHRLHEYQLNNQGVIQNLVNSKNRRPGAKNWKGNMNDSRTSDGDAFFIPRSFRGPPKVRNPEDYDFGICIMSANSVLAPEKRENIRGVVKFFQKKGDDTLHIYVRVRGLNFLVWKGLEKNTSQSNQLSLHIHESGDLSKGCESLGDLYHMNNGTEFGTKSHVGDFGNVVVDEDGSVHLIFVDSVSSLQGNNSIIGKSLVIHSSEEDLSLPTDDLNSLTSKNTSDKRLACCVIEKTRYQ